MKEMISIIDTSVYFPEEIETAKDLEKKTEIPESVIIEKFGLRQKHVAPPHVLTSDLAIKAARPILEKTDPLSIDAVIYFGSPHKDYPVWSIAAKIQHELGARNAFAFEIMNVSSCFPIALKVAKDMLVSDQELNRILLVAGCKESQIIDYANPRSRFMFNFADGGAAALIERGPGKARILGSSIMTDGSFHDDIMVPAGGSKLPASIRTVESRQHYIDVIDPPGMKARLDPLSIPNFERVIRQSVEKSGYSPQDIRLLLPLHTKRSMFLQLLDSLNLTEQQAIYLDEYGHLSALDPCIGLHLAEKRGLLAKGNLAVAVSAGTGYTWAATAIEWTGE